MIDNALPTGYIYSHADSNRRADAWEELVAYITEGYTSQLPENDWAMVSDFTRERVLMTSPRTLGEATKTMGFLSRYLVWATIATGMPVGPDIMRPRLIDRYLLSGLQTKRLGQRAKVRNHLRICLLQPAPESLSARDVNALPEPNPDAMSWAEVVEAFNWAQSLDGDHRRRAEVWIALAAGCGAMTSEIQRVLRGDVLIEEEGASVRIGGNRPRTVPVLKAFTKIVTRLAEGDPYAPLADWRLKANASRNNYAGLQRTWEQDAPPRLRGNRLRGFWFQQQLQQLPMLAAFVTASGLLPGTLLNNWGRFAQNLPSEEEVRRLRDPGATR